jgi:hypothetical protein
MDKQKAYTERQKAKGLRIVRVWVPKDKTEQLKRYAEKLRKQ